MSIYSKEFKEKRAEETLRESVWILMENFWSWVISQYYQQIFPEKRILLWSSTAVASVEAWNHLSVSPMLSVICIIKCWKSLNILGLCTLLGVASEMLMSHPFLHVIKKILWNAKPFFIKITVSCGIRKHWHFTCTTSVRYFYAHADEKGCAVYVGVLN